MDKSAIADIIMGTSSETKKGLVDKINQALDKMDRDLNKNNAAADLTSAGVGALNAVAPAIETKKQKAKKQEKTAKLLGDDSIYAGATHNSATNEEEPEYINTGLKGVWNRFVNKRINKAQEKADKKVAEIDKKITNAEKYRHSKTNTEDVRQQDYMVPDDFDLYVPNTYTGAGTMDFNKNGIYYENSAYDVMGPQGNKDFTNKRNFYKDYQELENYVNEDDEAIRFAVKDKIIAEKHPLLEQENLINNAAVATVREAAKRGLENAADPGSSLTWNSIFEKIADEFGVTFPHKTYQQAMDTVNDEYERLIKEEKKERKDLLKAFIEFGKEMSLQKMPEKYESIGNKTIPNPEYNSLYDDWYQNTFRDIGNYDLDYWDDRLEEMNKPLNSMVNHLNKKKEKTIKKAEKKQDFRDDLYL